MEHDKGITHIQFSHKSRQSRPGGEGMIMGYMARFCISFLLTVPLLLLSPTIRGIFGPGEFLPFYGKIYMLFALASVVYYFGGYPFLKGFFAEIRARRPGIMTLVAVVITTVYVYSSAVAFGFKGRIFFWELASLIDLMLLWNWIKMT